MGFFHKNGADGRIWCFPGTKGKSNKTRKEGIDHIEDMNLKVFIQYVYGWKGPAIEMTSPSLQYFQTGEEGTVAAATAASSPTIHTRTKPQGKPKDDADYECDVPHKHSNAVNRSSKGNVESQHTTNTSPAKTPDSAEAKTAEMETRAAAETTYDSDLLAASISSPLPGLEEVPADDEQHFSPSSVFFRTPTKP